MSSLARSLAPLVLIVVVVLAPGLAALSAAAPAGEMTWAIHVTLAPKWLDPAETESAITPFMVWENGFIRGVGSRVEEGALTLIPAFPYSAPLEDLRLKR